MARLHLTVLLACIAALAAPIDSAAVKDKDSKQGGKAVADKQLQGPLNTNVPPVPTDTENLPDEYVPCAYENDVCQCDGYVILGDPELNQWSELANSAGAFTCTESSFSAAVKTGTRRQCWCKARILANRDDLGNTLPKLPDAAFQTIAPGLIWWPLSQYSIFNSVQSWDVLAVDTTLRRIDIAYSQGANLPVPDLARMRSALAAVNGGFHAYGTSLGGITELRVDGIDIVKEDTGMLTTQRESCANVWIKRVCLRKAVPPIPMYSAAHSLNSS